jgi:uroporphyrinogen decarboxylase
MQCTSFERVKLALEHKEPDRIPFDIGGTAVTGINIRTLKRLKKYLGLSEKAELWDRITQLAKTDNELIDKLKIDVKNVGPNALFKPGLSKDLGLEGNHYRVIDEFGIGWQMPVRHGHFYDLYLYPLKDAETVEDIKNYSWPDPLGIARYTNLRNKADQVVYQEKKAYVLGRMSAGMWENATWMTGHEKFFSDMLLNPKVVQAIMDKFLEIKMKYWEKALETVGENVLIISTADDLGAQESLLVSLELYKKLVWPYHKKLFSFIKEKAKSRVYIFFHCDGAIKEAIPLLIEAGVDILNPVQVSCRGMETKTLKKEFGDDLTFWGGSCDNNILTFGTPEEVREETKKRIYDLADGGGFIFAPIHIIQSVVPVENIISWWETLQELGKY